MKIVFCGYDFFANCLDAIVKHGHDVAAIYTIKGDGKYNFSNQVIELAEAKRVPVNFHRISRDEMERIAGNGCDVLISAAYPYKIPVIPNGIRYAINIHPTLLPDGRGPWPLPQLITKYPEKAGVTIHKISPAMDSGDILLARPITIDAQETYESLAAKCRLSACEMLVDILTTDRLRDLWTKAVPQGEGSYWPMPTENEQIIDWMWPVKKIDAFVRSYGKCECMGDIEGQRFDIQDVSVWGVTHSHPPGSVVLRTNREIVVAASDGMVCLRHYARTST